MNNFTSVRFPKCNENVSGLAINTIQYDHLYGGTFADFLARLIVLSVCYLDVLPPLSTPAALLVASNSQYPNP